MQQVDGGERSIFSRAMAETDRDNVAHSDTLVNTPGPAVSAVADTQAASARSVAPSVASPAGASGGAADPLAGTLATSQPSSEPSRQRELVPGTRVDRFVIEERLGAGAMGVVYAARDPELDRRVAIKLIRAVDEGDNLRARLYREAQALARVAHPNVVTVHEVGSHGDQVYVAMELVRGSTLRGWLEAAHPTADILRMLVEAGRGLAAAHSAVRNRPRAWNQARGLRTRSAS